MDGWTLAQKIFDMKPNELKKCFKDFKTFDDSLLIDVFNLDYETALEAYTSYEETYRFGLIDPGDEVKIIHPLLKDEMYGLVLGITKDYIYILPNRNYRTEDMDPVLKLMLNIQGISIKRTSFNAYVISEYTKGDVK